MASKLNASAAPFYPSSVAVAQVPDDIESDITPEDLEELEAAESWVSLMADIELEEREFLIDMALMYAPEEVEQIEREALA